MTLFVIQRLYVNKFFAPVLFPKKYIPSSTANFEEFQSSSYGREGLFAPWLIYGKLKFSYFLASYSLGFATKCQKCSAGFKCPGRKSVEQCPFDSANGYTYSTDTSKWWTVLTIFKWKAAITWWKGFKILNLFIYKRIVCETGVFQNPVKHRICSFLQE